MIMGVSGARGLVGAALTAEVASRLAAAFGYAREGSVLVARDSRPSGAALAQSVCAGLASVGCRPVMAAICTTPGAQVGVERLGLSGGIMITASHNPAPWNGLKFIESDGAFITAEQARAVYTRAAGEFPRRAWDGWPAPAASPDIGLLHAELIGRSPLIDAVAIRRCGLRVVVDSNHGAAGPLIRMLARMLDMRLTVLGEDPTGLFKHTPEPIPEHLGELASVVAESGADVGAAIDPDGDRLTLCTREGLLPEEATLAIIAAAMLRPGDGPVVTNLSTSRMIDDVAGRRGVPVIRTPVGEAHVVAAMKAVGSSLGGEGNGGIIIPSIHHGRDAAAGLAILLSHMALTGQTLSRLWEDIPKYAMAKRKVAIGPDALERFSRSLESSFDGFTLDTRDGFKLIWPNRWLHVRRSNTEPVARIIAESPDRAEVAAMIGAAERLLTDEEG
ncbi:MAG: phosphoglucosamine mutase [Candidatus Eisenbacteria bacterium]|nr:phosphoglucosamine mutase [Candidatus Eisenbacteria bacterium]